MPKTIEDNRVSTTEAFAAPRLWAGRFCGIAFGLMLGVIVVAATLEVWLRLAHVLDLQRYSIHYGFGPGAEIRFRPAKDFLLGWEHSNSSPGDPFGNDNANYPINKEPGVCRILVIGDSITANSGYVRYLRQLLDNAFPGKRYEVWNGGVGGYNLNQHYYNLKYKGWKLNPDMIVIGFCLNDVYVNNILASVGDDGRWRFFRVPLFNNSSIGVNRTLFLYSHAYRYVRLAVLENVHSASKRSEIAAAEEAFAMIVDEARKRNVAFLGVIIPYFKSEYMPREINEYATIRRLLDTANVRYIDLHGAFQNIDDARWRERPDDFVHPSPGAHRVIAGRISDYLAANTAFWNGPAQ